jgi:hypothetical protein
MMTLLAATTTTVLNVHLGRPLPIARAVVVAVPLIALSVFAWLRTRRTGPRP